MLGPCVRVVWTMIFGQARESDSWFILHRRPNAVSNSLLFSSPSPVRLNQLLGASLLPFSSLFSFPSSYSFWEVFRPFRLPCLCDPRNSAFRTRRRVDSTQKHGLSNSSPALCPPGILRP